MIFYLDSHKSQVKQSHFPVQQKDRDNLQKPTHKQKSLPKAAVGINILSLSLANFWLHHHRITHAAAEQENRLIDAPGSSALARKQLLHDVNGPVSKLVDIERVAPHIVRSIGEVLDQRTHDAHAVAHAVLLLEQHRVVHPRSGLEGKEHVGTVERAARGLQTCCKVQRKYD